MARELSGTACLRFVCHGSPDNASFFPSEVILVKKDNEISCILGYCSSAIPLSRNCRGSLGIDNYKIWSFGIDPQYDKRCVPLQPALGDRSCFEHQRELMKAEVKPLQPIRKSLDGAPSLPTRAETIKLMVRSVPKFSEIRIAKGSSISVLADEEQKTTVRRLDKRSREQAIAEHVIDLGAELRAEAMKRENVMREIPGSIEQTSPSSMGGDLSPIDVASESPYALKTKISTDSDSTSDPSSSLGFKDRQRGMAVSSPTLTPRLQGDMAAVRAMLEALDFEHVLEQLQDSTAQVIKLRRTWLGQSSQRGLDGECR